MFGLPLKPQLEQVAYFRGAPDSRPSLIDHGGGPQATGSGSGVDGHGDVRPAWYGLVAPGVGFKVAQDGARPARFDPDRPDRPLDDAVLARACAYVRDRFPGLDPGPVHTEACLYTMSPDGDFILDRIDGVVVCGGDSGHAFKFGPLLGRLAADLAQGRQLPPEAAMWRVDRLRGVDPDDATFPLPTAIDGP
jgi:sarcosine oxidase